LWLAPRERVRHRQEQRYAAQDQAAYEQQLAQQQAAPAPPDYTAELHQLAQLKAQGIITEEEFEAKKRQILGI
jgi:Short C-terminal domain